MMAQMNLRLKEDEEDEDEDEEEEEEEDDDEQKNNRGRNPDCRGWCPRTGITGSSGRSLFWLR